MQDTNNEENRVVTHAKEDEMQIKNHASLLHEVARETFISSSSSSGGGAAPKPMILLRTSKGTSSTSILLPPLLRELTPTQLEEIKVAASQRWLVTSEIYKLLHSCRRLGLPLQSVSAHQPPSGSWFLYPSTVKFRADGYNYTRFTDTEGYSVLREHHVKLSLSKVKVLACYYSQREDMPSFGRRVYWLLRSEFPPPPPPSSTPSQPPCSNSNAIGAGSSGGSSSGEYAIRSINDDVKNNNTPSSLPTTASTSFSSGRNGGNDVTSTRDNFTDIDLSAQGVVLVHYLHIEKVEERADATQAGGNHETKLQRKSSKRTAKSSLKSLMITQNSLLQASTGGEGENGGNSTLDATINAEVDEETVEGMDAPEERKELMRTTDDEDAEEAQNTADMEHRGDKGEEVREEPAKRTRTPASMYRSRATSAGGGIEVDGVLSLYSQSPVGIAGQSALTSASVSANPSGRASPSRRYSLSMNATDAGQESVNTSVVMQHPPRRERKNLKRSHQGLSSSSGQLSNKSSSSTHTIALPQLTASPSSSLALFPPSPAPAPPPPPPPLTSRQLAMVAAEESRRYQHQSYTSMGPEPPPPHLLVPHHSESEPHSLSLQRNKTSYDAEQRLPDTQTTPTHLVWNAGKSSIPATLPSIPALLASSSSTSNRTLGSEQNDPMFGNGSNGSSSSSSVPFDSLLVSSSSCSSSSSAWPISQVPLDLLPDSFDFFLNTEFDAHHANALHTMSLEISTDPNSHPKATATTSDATTTITTILDSEHKSLTTPTSRGRKDAASDQVDQQNNQRHEYMQEGGDNKDEEEYDDEDDEDEDDDDDDEENEEEDNEDDDNRARGNFLHTNRQAVNRMETATHKLLSLAVDQLALLAEVEPTLPKSPRASGSGVTTSTGAGVYAGSGNTNSETNAPSPLISSIDNNKNPNILPRLKSHSAFGNVHNDFQQNELKLDVVRPHISLPPSAGMREKLSRSSSTASSAPLDQRIETLLEKRGKFIEEKTFSSSSSSSSSSLSSSLAVLLPLPSITDSTSGQSLLHLASKAGSVTLVRALLLAGADPNVTDVHGNTPAEVARINGHDAVVALLDALEIPSNLTSKKGMVVEEGGGNNDNIIPFRTDAETKSGVPSLSSSENVLNSSHKNVLNKGPNGILLPPSSPSTSVVSAHSSGVANDEMVLTTPVGFSQHRPRVLTEADRYALIESFSSLSLLEKCAVARVLDSSAGIASSSTAAPSSAAASMMHKSRNISLKTNDSTVSSTSAKVAGSSFLNEINSNEKIILQGTSSSAKDSLSSSFGPNRLNTTRIHHAHTGPQREVNNVDLTRNAFQPHSSSSSSSSSSCLASATTQTSSGSAVGIDATPMILREKTSPRGGNRISTSDTMSSPSLMVPTLTAPDTASVAHAVALMSSDELLDLEVEARIIQSGVRAWLIRRNYNQVRKATRTLQLALRRKLARKRNSSASGNTEINEIGNGERVVYRLNSSIAEAADETEEPVSRSIESSTRSPPLTSLLTSPTSSTSSSPSFLLLPSTTVTTMAMMNNEAAYQTSNSTRMSKSASTITPNQARSAMMQSSSNFDQEEDAHNGGSSSSGSGGGGVTALARSRREANAIAVIARALKKFHGNGMI